MASDKQWTVLHNKSSGTTPHVVQAPTERQAVGVIQPELVASGESFRVLDANGNLVASYTWIL